MGNRSSAQGISLLQDMSRIKRHMKVQRRQKQTKDSWKPLDQQNEQYDGCIRGVFLSIVKHFVELQHGTVVEFIKIIHQEFTQNKP